MPVVAIIGRPNVGKSTLFNRLMHQRKAIEGDRPGVTVDRLEGDCSFAGVRATLVDTGGIGEGRFGDMQEAIDQQVQAALDVADVVLLVVDGQQGRTAADMDIAAPLRRRGLPVILVVNKAERPGASADFFAMGMGEPLAVSAVHGQGIDELSAAVAAMLPPAEAEEAEPVARIAVVGRPNVGKSSLVNAWLGKARMVVSAKAGTTRDAIDSDLAYGDGFVRLIDTAGQRKQGRIRDTLEFVASVKARQAMARADAAVMLLDAVEGIVEQDLRMMQEAQKQGCTLVVAVNKVDVLADADWKHLRERLDFRMRALPDVPLLRVSAKEGRGVRRLLREAVAAARRNGFSTGTGELNRWLQRAQEEHPPPPVDGSPVRLKYCVQTGTNPPKLKLFGNRPAQLRRAYVRYLEHHFRMSFDLPGVPVRLTFSGSENPYA